MPTLVSPGVSVTIIDESFYIPASAPTVPLIFIATRADKLKVDGVTDASGCKEHSVVRTITSLNQSVDTYGVPYFWQDNSGAEQHGDARNEYGLFALNQYLNIGNVAYVVRADVDTSNNPVLTLTTDNPVREGTGGSMTGNGTITDIVVNQNTAEVELWTVTVNSVTPLSVTSITRTNNTATVTLASQNTTLVTGEYVTISGANEGDYNGSFQITVTNSSHFTYQVANSPATPATGTIRYAATIFHVHGSSSGDQGDATIGVPYSNTLVSFTLTQGSTHFIVGDDFYFNVISSMNYDPLGVGDAAKRLTIVTALQEEINSNSDVKSDMFEYNLILCPGYHEVVDEMLGLCQSISEEAFVIADTPFNLTPEDTATWAMTVARYRSADVGYYYPSALSSNLDGRDVLVAASGCALKVFAYSDNVSEVWFPPAGFRRGVLTGVSNMGYVSGTLGTATTFVSTPLNQGQRDILYQFMANINIIPFFPGRGIVVFGQKTSYSLTSALDRINVMRMLMKIKRDIRKAAMAYLFELNDKITRDSIKAMIDGYLNDIMMRRGLYDYVVLCDDSNNTPVRIDRNELWVDIALKPTKAVEFIYIPIRVVSTGANIH